MNNPFKPGSGLYPPFFAGRKRELDVFQSKLEQTISGTPMHMSVIGDWATGKTSLMRRFREHAQQEGCFVSEIISPAARSVGSFIDAVSDNLMDDVKRTKGRKIQKSIADSLKEVDGVGVSAFGFGASVQRSKQERESTQFTLRANYRSLWKHLSKEYGAIVLIIDDFDLMTDDPKVMKEIMLTHRNSLMEAIKDGVNIMCVLTGARLFSGVEPVHGPFVRFFEPYELGNLTMKDGTKAIRTPLRAADIRFTDNVIERIVNVTDGHPYYIQEFCYLLYENAIHGMVDDVVFDTVYYKIINDLARKMWKQRLFEIGDNSLKVLFLVQTGTTSTELIIKTGNERFGLKSATIRSCLTRLQQAGLISRVSRGEYRMADKLMGEYISSLF